MAVTTKITMLIPQGSTYIHTFNYMDDAETAIDLSNFTARMQIRTNVSSTTVLHEATTENGGIAIDGPAGEVELTISTTDTTAFAFTTAVFDIEIIASDGTVTRLVKGKTKIDPEVTR